MTKQEAKERIKMATPVAMPFMDMETLLLIQATDIAIECIENLDILVDYVVDWANQGIICDDLYDYDEVGEDSWCARNCKSFNRECVLKWLEYKRGDNE